jgi:hypothetical protein
MQMDDQHRPSRQTHLVRPLLRRSGCGNHRLQFLTAPAPATPTYRDIYSADGTLLETVQENYSDYHKHPEDIQWPPEKLAADAAKAAAEAAG